MGELDSSDYRLKCSKRLRRVLEYVDSVQFEKDILICFVGSIPKYHLVRCVEMNKNETSSNERGISYGLSQYKTDVANILRGKGKRCVCLIETFPPNPFNVYL